MDSQASSPWRSRRAVGRCARRAWAPASPARSDGAASAPICEIGEQAVHGAIRWPCGSVVAEGQARREAKPMMRRLRVAHHAVLPERLRKGMRAVGRCLADEGASVWRAIGFGPDAWMNRCRRIVHVGANEGQERDLYRLGLKVVCVEPIPEVCGRLADNIARRLKQRAVCAVLAERTGDRVPVTLRATAAPHILFSTWLCIKRYRLCEPDSARDLNGRRRSLRRRKRQKPRSSTPSSWMPRIRN